MRRLQLVAGCHKGTRPRPPDAPRRARQSCRRSRSGPGPRRSSRRLAERRTNSSRRLRGVPAAPNQSLLRRPTVTRRTRQPPRPASRRRASIVGAVVRRVGQWDLVALGYGHRRRAGALPKSPLLREAHATRPNRKGRGVGTDFMIPGRESPVLVLVGFSAPRILANALGGARFRGECGGDQPTNRHGRANSPRPSFLWPSSPRA